MTHLDTQQGSPTPLGATKHEKRVNFALVSPNPDPVILGLFDPKDNALIAELPMNRTGDVWHISIYLPKAYDYAFQLKGKEWFVDPQARSLNTTCTWGETKEHLKGRLVFDTFDWEGDSSPNIPLNKLIIYEMHVRGFTHHPSSQVKAPGTYLGVIDKIPHLQELGINAVELLPIFEFDETSNVPKTDKRLYNYWGYSTLNYFTPMKRYASSSAHGDEIREFRDMVKALHLAGIEVILDVVYNHTAPSHSFDETTFYLHGPGGEKLNYSGCGNTVNCNHPLVIEWILASLRHWACDMHVDGFRFDLASILCRGAGGEVLDKPPIIEAINKDPALKHVKLIAEPWDCGGLYQVGNFPGGARWADWNGTFRDTMRRFIKGTDNTSAAFARALSGSRPLYESKGSPANSINFITAHDGFTLRDLVSYQDKHNLANGEHNCDGNPHNESWNCGVEGSTDNPTINQLRDRQMRNFILALFLSQGTPMMLMGDEYGHTRRGNNNTYCQDNDLNDFLWDQLENNFSFFEFVKQVIHLRKSIPQLTSNAFWNEEQLSWHSIDEENHCVAFSLPGLYVAFNAHSKPVQLTLPPQKWNLLFDTASPNTKGPIKNYLLSPYTTLVAGT